MQGEQIGRSVAPRVSDGGIHLPSGSDNRKCRVGEAFRLCSHCACACAVRFVSAQCDVNDDGDFVPLYSIGSLMHTCGTAQGAELQQWRHRYFSLVVRQGVRQCFTVVGQAWLVCFMA